MAFAPISRGSALPCPAQGRMSNDAAGFASCYGPHRRSPIRAFDAGLRPGPFPDRAASLLPGLLAATRTGLPPAGDDELTNTKKHHGITSRCHLVLLGAEIGSLVLPQPRFPEVRRGGCGDGCGERSGQSVAAAVRGCLSPRSGDWDARTAISDEAAVRAAVSLIARHGCRRAEPARDPGSAISAANGWPWSLCAAPPPIGLTAAYLFAGGEGSRADSRVRSPAILTCACCPAVRSALDAVPEAYHNPAAVWWGPLQLPRSSGTYTQQAIPRSEPSQNYSRIFISSTTAASAAAVLGMMPNLPGSGTPT